jgi:hypothetical protein
VSALPVIEAPYGSAPNPLRSVDEPCPDCGRPLTAHTGEPSADAVRLAAQILEPHDQEHWRAICTVNCKCGFLGSAYRPGHPTRRST